MRASHLSSSTTTGNVSPKRFAVATSPHVIRKQPSPTRQTTGRSGRTSFAAIAPGRPKPMDDQPLVIWNVFGEYAVHWLAIWCVWAPTSNDRMPARGKALRTASIAAWVVKAADFGGGIGRKAIWNDRRWS